jgi:hypothetical protein
VEVYFPESQTWVTFDPTPAAGKTEPMSAGLAAQLGKYAEALELIWFQYVVGYDKQEQRSLATTVSARINRFRVTLEQMFAVVRKAAASGGRALGLIVFAGVTALFISFVAVRVRRFGWRRSFSLHPAQEKTETTAVEFYQRLLALLEMRGLQRNADLTPLEFASGLDSQPALSITRAYNRVRFGGQKLSPAELREIEQTLKQLEGDTSK